MQRLRTLFVPLLLATCMVAAPGLTCSALVGQEPEAQPPPQAQPAEPAAAEGAEEQAPARRRQGRRGGRRRALTVIEAGTVHPVSGPPIQNGVVVIRGERILAVGQQGDLQLPENTTVFRFPEGHVYPGLVDASTDAFTDAGMRGDSRLNGGSELVDGLVWTGSRDDQLARHGITTAYVHVRSGAQLRGQGAIVRPRADGFEVWEGKEQAALQLRMAAGGGSSHPLQRQAQLTAVGNVFNGLEQYRDAKEKFEKDLEKYEKDFAEYLEHHSKKNGKGKKAEAAKDPGTEPKAEGGGGAAGDEPRRRGPGRRRPPRGGDGKELASNGAVAGEAPTGEVAEGDAVEQALATLMALVGSPEQAAAPDPKGGAKPPQGKDGKPAAASSGKPGTDKSKKDDGPKRPTYPKKPKEDEQKDALAKVVDGALPLRIEAHRVEELRAALALQRDNEVPLMVLEQAYEAASIADQIAEQGATVVLTDVMPHSLGAPGDRRNPMSEINVTALPHHLDAAGVPFAIASGKARLAAVLPMMAAAAIGGGCTEAAALRALTLTPAEILGVAEDTGSLSRDKLADVLVTDRPLFETDSRVLLVLSKGRTEYRAK